MGYDQLTVEHQREILSEELLIAEHAHYRALTRYEALAAGADEGDPYVEHAELTMRNALKAVERIRVLLGDLEASKNEASSKRPAKKRR